MSVYLKRVYAGWGMYWAALITLGSCLYAAIGVLSYQGLAYYTKGDVIYFLILPRNDVINLFLPLIATLPAASLCAEDRTRGYMSLILQRCGRKRYIAYRLGQAIIGASFAATLGLIAYFSIVYALSPYTSAIDNLESFKSYRSLILSACALPLALDTVFRVALSAAAWAVVGVGFAAFLGEVQAILATVITYYFVSQLLVGSALNDWMPQRVQMPDIFTWAPLWKYSLRQMVELLLALVFGGGCLYGALGKRGAMRP